MKRRMIAPASGKKIKKDRMGIPKMSMKLAPFAYPNDANDSE
jgi:hypothetical protein